MIAAAFANPFSQLINSLGTLVATGIDWLYGLTHNYGWSMLLLALGVSLLVLPLSIQSLKSMREMQALAPYIKRLQVKYKNERQKLGEEQMKLYREHGVNPLGGCLPMIAQYPFLIAVYHAIQIHNDAFKNAHWLWIGSSLSHSVPNVLATSLSESDHVLLVAYALSMYLSIKLTPTMSTEPQQQQMMKMQAFMMPVMLYVLGSLYHWSSAFILYWFGFNVLSMLERWYIMRMPSRIPKPLEDTPATLAGYPRDCPECHKPLTIVKGSKCEECGAKVRKLAPSDNGLAAGGGIVPATPGGGKSQAKGARKSS
ncbi:MAG: hypothetical protein DLM53_02005 [Candidatus Eremiobacter antarcticus]|nr:membrane protein insertase YidC [Candidatus Eremiobacteraeota bacterium]MBC5808180.1 membrane protein insertase YidC [Candidatus Eremiobacteraeota bacterium]PZR63574.1 MAG: hypothetical protein DLM53_02005 [Candidatus Eremiobacter sp. RRmetagenome_bin22]